ncbi:hypothetical protein ACOCEA_17580 [Maribacter sp. CXY002]|uniref:hypothetical protein n=1 Tax=Maribacter luteocoastalis TaxID=3407671 RepID=UPI003B67FF0A
MKQLKSIWNIFIVASILLVASCGPVVISSRPSSPPPPWFYPNRLEVVRYIYFPEFHIYYDLSARTYLYLDGGIWIRRNVLPPKYRGLDLRRSRYERIRNYHDDDIKRYHEEHNANRGRSNRTTRSPRDPRNRN